MYFSVKYRTALATFVVLASLGDLRVSSSALHHAANSPTDGSRVFDSARSHLGYFDERYDNDNADKCNSTNAKWPVGELFGGDTATFGQFPWMAVVHQLIQRHSIYVCSGTIISVRWILTAGHCVAKSPKIFFVVLGDTDKKNIHHDTYNGPGIAMLTTKGALHPQYRHLRNDIGLLWMPRDITFNAAIQPIRLAGASYASYDFVGSKALILGWGRGGSQKRFRKLQYGSVPIISNSQCSRDWGVDDRQLCTAAQTGQDVCMGDSGGPLIVVINGDYLQIGVVSYGDDDCPSSRAGVYTRVSTYSRWIQDVTGIKY